MKDLKELKFVLGESYKSPFVNEIGVFQDGTVPLARDKNGKLWALSGHSHCGHIGVFCGNTLSDMKEVYPATFLFCTGRADYAFSGIKYPEGVSSRGSVWPFGLYICKETGRFYGFFHNETGWVGYGTAYDAFGLCNTPVADADFRHIGLMHSDDQGKSWAFDRWILSSEEVCFTENFIPDGVNIKGQKNGVIGVGSGDFSLFVPQDDEFMYLFYNIVRIDTIKKVWVSCDTYLARIRKRSDGAMGDAVKYYNGSFCEAGNFGKETAIVKNAWHSRVAYSKLYRKYMMFSSPVCGDPELNYVLNYIEVRFSDDLIHWSEPQTIEKDGKLFGAHYNAAISYRGTGDPFVITGDEFTVLMSDNGTDVIATDVKF